MAGLVKPGHAVIPLPQWVVLVLAGVAATPGQATAAAAAAPASAATEAAASAAATSTAAASAAASAASAAAAASTAAATTAAAATASATTTTTAPDKVNIGPNRSGVLLIEDVEGRQADVPDFFFVEGEFVGLRALLLRQIRGWCRGCAARQRQQSSGSQNWYGFGPTLSLRNRLRARHGSLQLFGDVQRWRSTPNTVHGVCIGTAGAFGAILSKKIVREFERRS
jgi:hypothetical protein